MRLLSISICLWPHGYREPPMSSHPGSGHAFVQHDASRQGVRALAVDNGRPTGGC